MATSSWNHAAATLARDQEDAALFGEVS